MAGSVTPRAWLKRALFLVAVGLLVQTIAIVKVTPATFILFAVGGILPVVAGLGLFAYGLRGHRRAKDQPKEERPDAD